MIRNASIGMSVLAALALSACGGSTTDKTAKALSSLTSMSSAGLIYEQSKQELMARAGELMPMTTCTAADFRGSCTPSSITSLGCTSTGSAATLTRSCTLTGDFTACCGSTPFTIASGSTMSWAYSAFTYSASTFSITTRVRQNATVTGDGMTGVSVVCDYSQAVALNFTNMSTSYLAAGGATMTCEQAVAWYRAHYSEFLTLTITATSGDACTIGGTGVTAAQLQTSLGTAASACSTGAAG